MVSDVTKDAMEEAHNVGLSVNKYLLLQKTKEDNNAAASEESIKNNSTTAIMEAYNLVMIKERIF